MLLLGKLQPKCADSLIQHNLTVIVPTFDFVGLTHAVSYLCMKILALTAKPLY